MPWGGFLGVCSKQAPSGSLDLGVSSFHQIQKPSGRYFLGLSLPLSLPRTPVTHRLDDWMPSHRSPWFYYFGFYVFFLSALIWIVSVASDSLISKSTAFTPLCTFHSQHIFHFGWLNFQPKIHGDFFVSFILLLNVYCSSLLNVRNIFLVAVLTSLSANSITSATSGYVSIDWLSPWFGVWIFCFRTRG